MSRIADYHCITTPVEGGGDWIEIHGHSLCDEACGCECRGTAGTIEVNDGCSGFSDGK